MVENSQSLSPTLILGARNLEGVELMLNNEVHPYDLLRYERAIFSRAAIEQLQEIAEEDCFQAQAARAQAGGGGLMPTTYTVIRRARDHREGHGREGDRRHAGL